MYMEEKLNTTEGKKRDILFSKTAKAGQRIYYIDVKINRKEEMYLCITESKKVQTGTVEQPAINYEKHKIFLYREDFQKFMECINEAMQYISEQQGEAEPRAERDDSIKLDLEF